MARVAAIGECMLELSPRPGGLFALGFGGDTLNTAVYLARLGVAVDYLTALGEDGFSDRMLAGWRAEGIGTGLVPRLRGRLPGLYLIEIDDRGERRFSYWRESAPARELFTLPQTPEIVTALPGYDLVYLSGISLSLYGEPGRAVLFDALDRARAAGARVVFDGNYRPRNWRAVAQARAAMDAMLDRVDIVLTSAEDEGAVHGDADAQATVMRLRARGIEEIVVKLGSEGALVAGPAGATRLPATPLGPVVDTTAAGDSFNAAYLAARLGGRDAVAAAQAGHLLAGSVIAHPGAIIPREAMPAGLGAPRKAEAANG
ncbi:MAG: ketodeoxygluconokinase [Alphaproteobacteria bacterium]|nr:MAG: ketodeoxygluconokinase [Alphaproteobacteria bacterium]